MSTGGILLRHKALCCPLPSELKDLLLHLLRLFREDRPQQSAHLGKGHIFLAETKTLTQSTNLFLEKQPLSKARLTWEWGQLEITLTGIQPQCPHGQARILPPAIHAPVVADAESSPGDQPELASVLSEVSLLTLLNPVSFPPFQSLRSQEASLINALHANHCLFPGNPTCEKLLIKDSMDDPQNHFIE